MLLNDCNEACTYISFDIAVVWRVEPDDVPPSAFLCSSRGFTLIMLRGLRRGRGFEEVELEVVATVFEGLFIVRFGIIESITIT